MEPDISLPLSQAFSPIPILSQINPVYASRSYFLKTNFNIILPSTSKFSSWVSFPQIYPPKPLRTSTVSHTCHMPCPSHCSGFDYPNNICGGVDIMKFLTLQSSPILYCLFPPRLICASHAALVLG